MCDCSSTPTKRGLTGYSHNKSFWSGFEGTAISELVSFLHHFLRSFGPTSLLHLHSLIVAQAKFFADLSHPLVTVSVPRPLLWDCGCVGSHLRPRLRLHLVPACTFLSHMMGSFAKKDDFSLSLGQTSSQLYIPIESRNSGTNWEDM